MARVIGIGECNVDYIGVVERDPVPGRRQELSEFSIQGSGTVPTALVTLASFGISTELVAKLSDDDFGRFLVDELEALGVGTRAVAVEPDKVSPFAFITAVRGTGKHVELFTPGDVSELGPEEVRDGVLDEAEVLLIDGHHVAAQIRAAEQARERGIAVVTTAAALQEGMGDLLALSDVLLAGERFAGDVAPHDDLEETLRELAEMGPKVVVVTLGAEGSVGWNGESFVREAAAEADVVGRTGAGGVYRGAFVYGLLERWPLARSMHFASVAAALKCRAFGERLGIPELEEVLREI